MSYSSPRRVPMSDAEAASLTRRYHQTMERVDAALMAGPLRAYRATCAKVDALLGRHAARMHRLADASGKWWQHRDLGVLKKHIAERNRTINSAAYKAIQDAYRTPRAVRSSKRLAADDAYWGD